MMKPLKTRLVNAYYALRGIEPAGMISLEVPPITEEELTEAKSFFPMEKFFIFGHARSGTTMLARLIRLHPQVHCNYQAHFFTRKPLLESLVSSEDVREWLSRKSNRWNRGQDLSPVVLRAVADYILERDARLEGKRIVGDKSPSSLLDGQAVRLMHKIYPDARFIYIVRDGRDAAISHRFQAFIDFPEKLSKEDLQIRADFIQNPQVFLGGERSLFTRSALDQAAKGWERNVSETDRIGNELYRQYYISLRYEDLLQDPLGQMQRLWGFLEASPVDHDLEQALDKEMNQNPDSDWQQQKAKEIAQPLQKGKRGGWREILTSADRQAFEKIAGDTLKTWGYALENE